MSIKPDLDRNARDGKNETLETWSTRAWASKQSFRSETRPELQVASKLSSIRSSQMAASCSAFDGLFIISA